MFPALALGLHAHVDDGHHGHRTAVGPFGEGCQPILAFLNIHPGLQRGCRRAQHDRTGFDLPAHHGHVARIVTGFMLLIDDDQPQPRHRRENGGTGTHHDARLALTNAMPFIVALAI